MNQINKTTLKRQGFTIVELLIVIVVIGILAAITIVSYSGITARANATKAKTNGASVQKVAESYNADDGTPGGYPSTALLLSGYSGVARFPSGITLGAAGSVSGSNGTTALVYTPKSTTGGCIGWWDFGAATPALKYIAVGNAVVPAGELSCS